MGDKDKQGEFGWAGLLILFVVVLILWAFSWAFVTDSSAFKNWDERGAFGDMFGAINSLFSGLAFAGVIYAIYLQRKELLLQRRELELTRKELEGQKLQLEVQNVTNKNIRFENTLFELLNQLKSAIDGMRYSETIGAGGRFQLKTYKGPEAVNKLYHEFVKRSQGEHGPNYDSNAYYSRICDICDRHSADFTPVLDWLRHSVGYVNDEAIGNHLMYINLIRAQLGSNALVLAYYCISSKWRGYSRKAIIDSGIFSVINPDLLVEESDVDLLPIF